jgi:hypothetical protein
MEAEASRATSSAFEPFGDQRHRDPRHAADRKQSARILSFSAWVDRHGFMPKKWKHKHPGFSRHS